MSRAGEVNRANISVFGHFCELGSSCASRIKGKQEVQAEGRDQRCFVPCVYMETRGTKRSDVGGVKLDGEQRELSRSRGQMNKAFTLSVSAKHRSRLAHFKVSSSFRWKGIRHIRICLLKIK